FITVENLEDAKSYPTDYVTVETDDPKEIERATEYGLPVIKKLAHVVESRIDLKPGAGPREILDAYFTGGHYSGELDPNELLQLSRSILNESVEPQPVGSLRIKSVCAENFMAFDELRADLDQQ